MSLDQSLVRKFNKDVNAWARVTRQDLEFKLASLDLTTQIELLQKARAGREPLSTSIKKYVKKDFGQAEIIRFSFFKHGWFFDRGVGRGTPIASAGTGKRQPKPWIDDILESQVEELADMIVEVYGDQVVDDIKIRG